MTDDQGLKTDQRSALAVVLRVLGGLDLLALIAVAIPRAWLAAAHTWAGLGELPQAPIVGYLARTASAMYALHGATIVFISYDVRRYARLVTLLAALALVHGLVILAIDLAEGMPRWWTLIEAPGFAATGALVLLLQAWSGGDGNS